MSADEAAPMASAAGRGGGAGADRECGPGGRRVCISAAALVGTITFIANYNS